jgi:hypothetical protein
LQSFCWHFNHVFTKNLPTSCHTSSFCQEYFVHFACIVMILWIYISLYRMF